MNTQLNEPTSQNLLKPPKSLSQRMRKRYYKTLGTRVKKNSPLPPLSLIFHTGIGQLIIRRKETNNTSNLNLN